MSDEAEGGTDTVAEAQPAPKWTPETEHEARALGWKPPAEWKGAEPPGGLIYDPNTYLDRAEKFTPFRKLREKLETAERTADERLRKVEDASAKFLARQLAERDAKIAEIQAEKLKAVSEADTDRFKALDKAEKELAKPEPAPERPKGDDPHMAAIAEWSADKDWFRVDPILTQAAVAAYAEVEKTTADPKKRLAHVDKRLAEYFPQRFGAKPKAPADNAVEGGGMSFGGGKSNGYDSLPAEAKKHYQRYVADGIIKENATTKAQWAKDYHG